MNTELFCHKTYHDDFFQVHLIPSLTLTKSEYFDIENGFIKFLSETRETAYEYIENVQISIAELKDAIESGNEENIAVAYKKLIDFLPSSSTGMID